MKVSEEYIKQLELDLDDKIAKEQMYLHYWTSLFDDKIAKKEMYEMQKQVHGLQMRVKELSEENYELRKKIDANIHT